VILAVHGLGDDAIAFRLDLALVSGTINPIPPDCAY
jgi:hypothetical protein